MDKGKAGPPRVLVRRHFIKLSDELDAQVDRALDLVTAKVALDPVSATLGNPVAFPILFGTIGVLAVALYLRLKYPSLSDKDAAIEAAESFAEFLAKQTEGAADFTLEALKTLSNTIRDSIIAAWEAFAQDPLFGLGGKEPGEISPEPILPG